MTYPWVEPLRPPGARGGRPGRRPRGGCPRCSPRVRPSSRGAGRPRGPAGTRGGRGADAAPPGLPPRTWPGVAWLADTDSPAVQDLVTRTAEQHPGSSCVTGGDAAASSALVPGRPRGPTGSPWPSTRAGTHGVPRPSPRGSRHAWRPGDPGQGAALAGGRLVARKDRRARTPQLRGPSPPRRPCAPVPALTRLTRHASARPPRPARLPVQPPPRPDAQQPEPWPSWAVDRATPGSSRCGAATFSGRRGRGGRQPAATGRPLRRSRRDAEMIDVGKRAGYHKVTQDRMNQTLVDQAGRGAGWCGQGRGPVRVGPAAGGGGSLPRPRDRHQVVPERLRDLRARGRLGSPATHRTRPTASRSSPPVRKLRHAPYREGHTLILMMGVRGLARTAGNAARRALPRTCPWPAVERAGRPRSAPRSRRWRTSRARPRSEGVRAPAVILVGRQPPPSATDPRPDRDLCSCCGRHPEQLRGRRLLGGATPSCGSPAPPPPGRGRTWTTPPGALSWAVRRARGRRSGHHRGALPE
ncbi:hypothetical protein QJS66_01620 [Kocuria rhizophila]|nr:hypothetical protein QJS66_01620 [Kocuria rhizophila]